MSICEHGIDSRKETCTECYIAGMQADIERLGADLEELEAENARLWDRLKAIHEICATWLGKGNCNECDSARIIAKAALEDKQEQIEKLKEANHERPNPQIDCL